MTSLVYATDASLDWCKLGYCCERRQSHLVL